MNTDFEIPIDKEITHFYHHLRTHERTIFSAKFGDGKSYFLNKFEKNPQVASEFKFLKVYPINYQVVGDYDIFNLLKYDILQQLLVEKMISPLPISGNFFDAKEEGTLLSALSDRVAGIKPSIWTLCLAFISNVWDIIKSVPKRMRIKSGGDNAARQILKDFENTSFLYGEDVATHLIKQSLRYWKSGAGENKRVVLVVEDLDRLDPSHLFRLLNVFSAHMDYIYKNGDAPTDSLVGSRFGFDNVVFVLEYDNLKHLFAHFYGDDSAFSGYINKFIPQGYFEYSLRKTANSFFYDSLVNKTGLDEVHVSALMNGIMNSISIRDMVYTVHNLEKQVLFESPQGVSINTGFLLMLAAMKRAGMNENQILQSCRDFYKNNPEDFIRYIIDFTFLDGFSDVKGRIKTNRTTLFYIASRNKDGFANVGRMMPVPDEMNTLSVNAFVIRLLDFIIP